MDCSRFIAAVYADERGAPGRKAFIASCCISRSSLYLKSAAQSALVEHAAMRQNREAGNSQLFHALAGVDHIGAADVGAV